ncbi:MAG: glycoside hydrolase family 28 protein [Tepidisphaeraceae bacterium]
MSVAEHAATGPGAAAFGPDRQRGWANVLDFGALGDGSATCTAALQRAIDQCGEAGGGTVLVPAGRYLTGTLWMRSHVNLHLDSGATLVGNGDVSAFPLWTSPWEGPGVKPMHAALIAGEAVRNVSITGRGTLDGGGASWWDLFRQKKLEHVRPNLVRLVDCRDVLIDGVFMTNSPFWTLNPTACDNVTISKVTIRNPSDSPNTDGINPDSCSNVHISDCHVDVGDDCVTIKSGTEEDGRATLRACENLTITNCTMLHGHGGVVMGSEMSGGVRNIAISNCVFSGTDRGIRLKSRRGRGSSIEDLRVDNIVMDDVLCPMSINLFYECGAEGSSRVTDQSAHAVDDGTPRFRRLRFSNILARRVKYAAGYVLGLPEMFVEDVAFDNISVYLDTENTKGGAPVMAPNIPDMCRAGIYLRNARNIKLRRIDVVDQLGPAVSITNCQDIGIGDLYAKRDGNAAIVEMDGKEVGDRNPGR